MKAVVFESYGQPEVLKVKEIEKPVFIFPKPANITFEQAGAVAIAAITALQGPRDYGKIQPGQKVLINGASGIPTEDLPFIFDRSWRGDKSRSKRTHSGFGLAIAKQLVLAPPMAGRSK